jgi:ATP-dependent protease ClpP protease subunit
VSRETLSTVALIGTSRGAQTEPRRFYQARQILAAKVQWKTDERVTMKSWFSIQSKKAGTAEIYIYDELGAFGIRADQFIEALKAKGDVSEIALHINSPGGDPFTAAPMYLALKRHRAKVTAYNDGLVASAASIVLMAGDHIVMAENTMLMIHDPIGGFLVPPTTCATLPTPWIKSSRRS